MCSWGRESPGDREVSRLKLVGLLLSLLELTRSPSSFSSSQFKLTGVGLGHGSYVNSVAYLAPTVDHPNGSFLLDSISSPSV